MNSYLEFKLLSDLYLAGSSSKTTACSSLNKFISDVQANDAPSGPITTAHSTSWVAAANAIKLARGC